MKNLGKLVRSRPGEPDKEWLLEKTSVILGRASTSDIILRDATAAPAHARLAHGESGWTLEDLGTTAGTLLNGAPVTRAAVKPGDIIEIGAARLRLSEDAPRTDPVVVTLDSEADLNTALAYGRITASVSDTLSPALVVQTPQKTWRVALDQELTTIGRHPSNSVDLNLPGVEHFHAQVERDGDQFTLRDLHTDAGTWIRDQRIDEYKLQEGDTIRIGDARLVFRRAFDSQDLGPGEPSGRPDGRARRPVVIVPGLMGSELWKGSECIWPNLSRLLVEPEIYANLDDPTVEARGLIQEVVVVPNLIKLEQYNRLGNYLEEGLGYTRGKDLLEFAYDWRQDIRLSARRLGAAIDAWQARVPEAAEPITLIGHSLGCLVSRYYVERLGGADKVERLLLMGGPHAGSLKALVTLLTAKILPFGLLGDRLRKVVAALPSMYQILPPQPCVTDKHGRTISLLADESWLPERHRPLLREARQFWNEIGAYSSIPAVSIFGYGRPTLTGATLDRGAGGEWMHVELATEMSGDDTILQQSAILKGSEIHPVQQSHGSLYTDNDVKMRLKYELTRED